MEILAVNSLHYGLFVGNCEQSWLLNLLRLFLDGVLEQRERNDLVTEIKKITSCTCKVMIPALWLVTFLLFLYEHLLYTVRMCSFLTILKSTRFEGIWFLAYFTATGAGCIGYWSLNPDLGTVWQHINLIVVECTEHMHILFILRQNKRPVQLMTYEALFTALFLVAALTAHELPNPIIVDCLACF